MEWVGWVVRVGDGVGDGGRGWSGWGGWLGLGMGWEARVRGGVGWVGGGGRLLG